MTDQPNIVICMCDQLRAFEVGCYGNPVVRTPNIDRLAAGGVRFEHAVTNNPVCMPARSCLLSGQYSRSCMGSLGNHTEVDSNGNRYLPEYPVPQRVHFPDRILPEQLKSAGYDTALIGKWHVQPSPLTMGFDAAVYPRVHHRHTGQTFIENTGVGEVVAGYSVEFEAERVAQFLHTPRERPFFLFYSISPPHMPVLDAPERYLTMYDPQEMPMRLNVYRDGKMAYDAHWFSIYLWDFLYHQEHLPHTQRLPDGFDLRRLTALYYGMTTWVDDMVGRLLHELELSGQADNTIILFVSDHGDNLGSHHTFNKDTLMEESIRIPFIVRAPSRLQPRVVQDHVASLIDVMPTLLRQCGVEVSASVQGRDLTPVLMGEADLIGDGAAVIETTSGQVGIRTSTHLYGARLSDDHMSLSATERWLFDLRDDPYQLTNLTNSGAQADLALQLHDRLESWNREISWLQKVK